MKNCEEYVVEKLEFFESECDVLTERVEYLTDRIKESQENLEYIKQFFHLADYPGDGVCIRFESLEGHTIDDAYHEKEFIKIVQILDLKKEESEE